MRFDDLPYKLRFYTTLAFRDIIRFSLYMLIAAAAMLKYFVYLLCLFRCYGLREYMNTP